MPTVSSSPFIEALRAWNRASAEWLGLDPTEVFQFDAERGERAEEWHVTWTATAKQTPTVGHVGAPGIKSDGNQVAYFGDLYLTSADVAAFEAAVGPKPEQFTPEERAQLARFAGLRP